MPKPRAEDKPGAPALHIAIHVEPNVDERKRHLALQLFFLKVRDAVQELEQKLNLEKPDG